MTKIYCLVGLGKHSINQIIPAIFNSGGSIISTVSSKKGYQNIKNFKKLSDAVRELNNEKIIFYLATPYTIHFKQMKEIISGGFSLFIEKPALTNSNELKEISSISARKQFYAECFMYRYTKMYREFIKIWNEEFSKILSLDINFTVPSFPENTFRSKLNINSVVLNDIGCYAISLLVDLNIEDLKISDENFQISYDQKNVIKILINKKNLSIKIRIGLDKEYKNFVVLKTNDSSYIFDMFFNGRKIKKNIFHNENKIYNSFIDNNGFEKMLSLSKSYWIESQKTRLEKMIKVCDIMRDIEKVI